MINFKIKSFLTILLTSLVFYYSTGQNPDKIMSDLQRSVESAPEEFHLIILHLSDRENIIHLKETARNKNITSGERAHYVTNTLYNKAKNTQSDLLNALYALSDEIVSKESIKSYWVTNAISLLAKKEAIYFLSERNDIDKIYGEIEAETTTDPEIVFSSEERSAVTNGIKAINAPGMWKLGYTGYSTKVFVMDSGVEYTHPALRQQYIGNIKPHEQSWTGDHIAPFDVGGHGTHVTGTIIGLDRRNQDTIGVAFNAHWIGGPVQFSNSPRQPYRVLSFIENMEFALNPDGDLSTTDDIPDAFNNSWGQTTFNESFCDPNALFSQVHLALEAAGVAMIWSSGNSGPGPSSITGYKNSNFDLVSSFAVGNVAQVAPFTIAESSSRGPSRCGGSGSLEIKPEVSAPGINVRSSYLNGTYANLTGTSMAAPHVSGAVLLLKEAYPYLSGEELLLALYYTATDLGPEGEDNDYGMGLIDVYAAYLYLKDSGNIPIPPAQNNLDLILTNIFISSDNICSGLYPLYIDVVNGGTDTIFTFSIEYYSDEDQPISSAIIWEGVLEPGTNKSIFIDNINFSNPGTFGLSVNLTLPNGEEDQRSLNNRLFQVIEVSPEPQLLFESEYTPCLGGIGIFNATSQISENNLIEWFSSPTSTSPFATGNQATIGSSLANQKLYVRESSLANVGKLISENDNYEYVSELTGMIFDVERDIILESFKSYARNTSLSIIRIVDSEDNEVFSTNKRADQEGMAEYKIDAYIPKGKNYRIIVNNSRNMAATGDNVNFPYNLDNIVSIKYSFTGNQGIETDVYRNFFDWKIKIPTCSIQEFEIPVDISRTPPDLNIVPSVDTLFLTTGNSVSFRYESDEEPISVFWDFGNEQTSSEKEGFAIYTEPGIYTVSLKINEGLECSSIYRKNIVVIDDTIVSNIPSYLKQISIYPNPFDQMITIKTGNQLQGESNISMINITGNTVYNSTLNLQEGLPVNIEVQHLPSGVYLLQIENNGHIVTHKLVK